MKSILTNTASVVLIAGWFLWELVRAIVLGSKAQIDVAEDGV